MRHLSKQRRRARRSRRELTTPSSSGDVVAHVAIVFCRGAIPYPHERHRGEGSCPVCRGLEL